MTTERDELAKIAEEVARSEGVELYWLEYRPGRRLLQVMVDKEGGVTLDDCARVSRALAGPFDEQIHRSYVLEVSSPGMDRPLHTEKHFRNAVGQPIRVKTYAPVQGGRVWSGRLLACHGRVLQLETSKGVLELPLDQLASARISPEHKLL